MANVSGLRSPPPPRSSAASPRPKFDSDLLKAYMKKLLSSTLQHNSWPEPKERERVKTWIKEIGERVKERMLVIQPRGLCVIISSQSSRYLLISPRYSKYIVLTQINENLGQGGRYACLLDVCHAICSMFWQCGHGLPLGGYRCYGTGNVCKCKELMVPSRNTCSFFG